MASPHLLDRFIPNDHKGYVVIDEVQRVPELLNEVHRLIEARGIAFALTGSSARKLRRSGSNLLAGRALTCRMHPLTAAELGPSFVLGESLARGHLPAVFSEADPAAFLASYVQTYLREEIQQEGLTRNLGAFARFLEAVSFSHAATLTISDISRECAVERKTVEGFIGILEDLLLASRVPVFSKRAKRKTVAHPKFFLFDAGVYRSLRPKGPFDRPEEIAGHALEGLVFQELRAINDYLSLGYTIYYWGSVSGLEVDFVLYGERGIHAIEVKHAKTVRSDDLRGLQAFLDDYPMAKGTVIYMGDRVEHEGRIELIPAQIALPTLAGRI
jgi:predicted AAA+ superfamily ATPase